jgi:ATP-binding protein involved in chromosome partitioning
VLSLANAENGETAPIRLPEARAIVAIASAKGGVGKTALCVNLAASFAIAGRKVGIVDADLNSPGVFAMLGMRPLRRFTPGEEMEPATGPLGIKAVSSALLADGEPSAFSFLGDDDAPPVSSNGSRPLELDHRATLRRLLATRFGPLDLILVDLASGLAQLHYLMSVAETAGVVMVSQPSDSAVRATRNAIEILEHTGVPILGLVENMLGFNCGSCHAVRPLFPQGEMARIERAGDVPILGRLPFDPQLADCCERGVLFVREHSDTPTAKQLGSISAALEREIARRAPNRPTGDTPS